MSDPAVPRSDEPRLRSLVRYEHGMDGMDEHEDGTYVVLEDVLRALAASPAGDGLLRAQAIIDADPRLAGMDPERLRLARALAAHPSCLGCGAEGDGGVTYCATHGDWLCERCVAAIRLSPQTAPETEPSEHFGPHFMGEFDQRPVSRTCPACRLASPTAPKTE